MRNSTDGFDFITESTKTIPLKAVSLGSDYKRTTTDGTSSIYVKVNQTGDAAGIPETITMESRKLASVSGRSLNLLYPKTTKNGFGIKVTDDWVRRTSDGDAKYDDACHCAIEFIAANGSNYIDGKDVAEAILHTLSSLLDFDPDGTLSQTQQKLTTLISGSSQVAQ